MGREVENGEVGTSFRCVKSGNVRGESLGKGEGEEGGSI